MKYHCESYDANGKRIGGFVIVANDMAEALLKASINIEVRTRPTQPEIRISILKE